MREALSRLITDAAKKDENFIALTGDHGYQLFGALRSMRPYQFLNCGIAEQNMIGVAAGLVKEGYKPIVYALGCFMMRAWEQIKLDLCFTNLPVVMVGDGAGLTYSTLGASHHCAEDIALLRCLPNISIYSPCDKYELEDCFNEAMTNKGPSYIRIGKSDRPEVASQPMKSTNAWTTHKKKDGGFDPSQVALIAHGSMTAIATEVAQKLNIDCISVPRLKPSPLLNQNLFREYQLIIVLEEHSQHGGLYSLLGEDSLHRTPYSSLPPKIIPLTLKDQFATWCGSYQYALSEHELDDISILERVSQIIG